MALYLFDVRSADGTRLRAWTNRADVVPGHPDEGRSGPVVLVCNGLGTNPYAWPSLLHDDCPVPVVSWYHRGTGGSERPDDPHHIGVDAFVEDALSVLDAVDSTRCVAAGWSIGVNTAFELAARHPERVSGLFAVAGTPGSTFATMLGPLHVPRPLRHPLTVGIAYALRVAGPLLSPVTTRFPWPSLAVDALRYSGFMLPKAGRDDVRKAVAEFTSTDVDWYMHLAVHASRHRRVPLSGITVPVTFVAGRWDVLCSTEAIMSASERLADARLVEVDGSHFLTLEEPQLVLDELVALTERVVVAEGTPAGAGAGVGAR